MARTRREDEALRPIYGPRLRAPRPFPRGPQTLQSYGRKPTFSAGEFGGNFNARPTIRARGFATIEFRSCPARRQARQETVSGKPLAELLTVS